MMELLWWVQVRSSLTGTQRNLKLLSTVTDGNGSVFFSLSIPEVHKQLFWWWRDGHCCPSTKMSRFWPVLCGQSHHCRHYGCLVGQWRASQEQWPSLWPKGWAESLWKPELYSSSCSVEYLSCSWVLPAHPVTGHVLEEYKEVSFNISSAWPGRQPATLVSLSPLLSSYSNR